jgi:hypothetical protein
MMMIGMGSNLFTSLIFDGLGPENKRDSSLSFPCR